MKKLILLLGAVIFYNHTSQGQPVPPSTSPYTRTLLPLTTQAAWQSALGTGGGGTNYASLTAISFTNTVANTNTVVLTNNANAQGTYVWTNNLYLAANGSIIYQGNISGQVWVESNSVDGDQAYYTQLLSLFRIQATTWLVGNGALAAPISYCPATNVVYQLGNVGVPHTWFVNPVLGNDTNYGLDEHAPFLTLSNAEAHAVNGDTIHAMKGLHVLTYNLYLNYGVNLEGEGRNITVFSNSVSTNAEIHPSGTNTLQNFSSYLIIRNSTSDGVGTAININNVEIRGAIDGILVSGTGGSPGWNIRNSDFSSIFDTFNAGMANTTAFNIYACGFHVNQTNTVTSTDCRAFSMGGGVMLNLVGCSLEVTNLETNTSMTTGCLVFGSINGNTVNISGSKLYSYAANGLAYQATMEGNGNGGGNVVNLYDPCVDISRTNGSFTINPLYGPIKTPTLVVTNLATLGGIATSNASGTTTATVDQTGGGPASIMFLTNNSDDSIQTIVYVTGSSAINASTRLGVVTFANTNLGKPRYVSAGLNGYNNFSVNETLSLPLHMFITNITSSGYEIWNTANPSTAISTMYIFPVECIR